MRLNYLSSNVSSKVNVNTLFYLIIAVIFFSCGKDNKKESTGEKTDTRDTSTVSAGSDSKNTDLMSNDFIINYDISGKMSGSMSMYRDGDKIKQIMNMEVMGVKTSSNIYIMNDVVYTITDVGGTKFGNKINLDEYNKKNRSTGETITDFKDFEKFLSDKKIIGTEEILGKKCDIYETAKGIDVSIYDKRYILKIKSPEFTAVATEMDPSPTFSANEFEIPDDVNFNSDGKTGFDKGALDSLAKKYIK